MSEREQLAERFARSQEAYVRKHQSFFENPSSARLEPFQIADGLYYVGDRLVCIHLIDTGDGLILLDSGFPGAAHLLVDSIWRARFDPKDVRWILHTHGHFDHFGASEEFRRMYGTKLAISRVDAELLREKPERALIKENVYPFEKVPSFDLELEDGDIFELGSTRIRCVLTPGHTPGVLSFFFTVTYKGNSCLAGLLGGVGTTALTLPYLWYHEYAEDCPQQMLASLEKMRQEPLIIHLGNHPGNNKTLQKREQMLQDGGNPFIDPHSWQQFLEDTKKNVEAVIKDNEALKKELIG